MYKINVTDPSQRVIHCYGQPDTKLASYNWNLCEARGKDLAMCREGGVLKYCPGICVQHNEASRCDCEGQGEWGKDGWSMG